MILLIAEEAGMLISFNTFWSRLTSLQICTNSGVIEIGKLCL